MADNLEKRTGHETEFHDMSDEEYDALDELLTRANPELTGIPGVFASQAHTARPFGHGNRKLHPDPCRGYPPDRHSGDRRDGSQGNRRASVMGSAR
jgi:hypothetical protein